MIYKTSPVVRLKNRICVKKYSINNKKQKSEYMKQYRIKNTSKLKKYSKEYSKKNRETLIKKTILYLKNNRWAKTFHAMRTRCNNKKAGNYKYYGGRGIRCLLKTKDVKLLWLRDKASNMKKPSIDRINNDGHYTLDNCRFIEMIENIKKRNKKLPYAY